MPYITSVQRIGRQQGRQEGRQEGRLDGLLKGIELGLKLKFGASGLALLPEISQIKDTNLLETILSGLETSSTIDELRSLYQQSTSS